MFEVRIATEEDAITLADLRVEFLQEVAVAGGRQALADTATARQAMLRYFSGALPAGEYLGWLAEAEGRVIGTSGLNLFRKPPTFGNLSGLDAYIMNMYTLPAFRGRSVARTLLGHAIAHARSLGVQRIWLHATTQGRPIYEKAGFIGTDDEMELVLSVASTGPTASA